MKDRIRIYRKELFQELTEILSFWMEHGPDPVFGGFYGRIDHECRVYPDSPKGIVLNSRVLWTFSAAYNLTQNQEYLFLARRAYQYIVRHFLDEQHGGVFWSVNFKGEVLDDSKLIDGVASCLYGVSEYYKATLNQKALNLAIRLYQLIEINAYDFVRKGYFDAFQKDWKPITEPGQNSGEALQIKSMNTHLQIAEAYANLYRIWPDVKLRHQMERLLEVFAHHILDDRTQHLNLHFDAKWQVRSDTVSYGHDIEAAWVLQGMAELIQHPGWTVTMRSLAVKIADAVTEGMDQQGGLYREPENERPALEKHGWQQAEAMLGFFNAYQVSGHEKYLLQSIRSWQFAKQHIKDNQRGEWFWDSSQDNTLVTGQDKVGYWKCPYHNGRACMELIHRIERISNLQN
jgi:mannobiose 2-epimerase